MEDPSAAAGSASESAAAAASVAAAVARDGPAAKRGQRRGSNKQQAAIVDDDTGDMPTIGDFFICREYTTKTYSLGGVTQAIDSLQAAATDFDLTGQVVWLVSVLTSWYIGTRGEELRGQDVIELGAGAGLCGLVASQFAASVCLTDYEDEVLALLDRNMVHVGEGCRGSVANLAWGDESSHAQLARQVGRETWRVIVGADILYWRMSVEPLIATVKVGAVAPHPRETPSCPLLLAAPTHTNGLIRRTPPPPPFLAAHTHHYLPPCPMLAPFATTCRDCWPLTVCSFWDTLTASHPPG
jgi:hypothetical protein